MRLLKLTLLLVLCACTHSVYAQRHYVGISALEVNYGLNIFGRNNTNLNLSVSKYRSRTTYWKIGLNYFEKSYNYSYESNTAEVPTIVSFSSTAKDYYIDAAYFKVHGYVLLFLLSLTRLFFVLQRTRYIYPLKVNSIQEKDFIAHCYMRWHIQPV